MPATKGQGAQLNVATAQGSNITITAVSAANPVVVTAVNTLSNGDIVTITGLVGPTNLNNRAFKVSAVSGSVFTLTGENGAGNVAYVSGGIANKQTMTAVGYINSITGFDGKAAEIDTTNLQSQAKEFQMGLQDFGNCTLGMFQLSDAGQTQLRLSKSGQALTAFSLALSDGTVAAFLAFVVQYTFSGVKPDGAVENSVVLRVTNAPAWFA